MELVAIIFLSLLRGVACLSRLLVSLVLIILLLLSMPVSGTPDPGEPWEELLRPLEICEGEELLLQGYLFVPVAEANQEILAGITAGSHDGVLRSRCRWVRVAGENGDYLVFRVEGEDIHSCRHRLSRLNGILKKGSPARVWSAEGLFPGSEEDLVPLAEKLAGLWRAEIQSWYTAGSGLNIMAFVPSFPGALDLDGAKVNLNLELHYDRFAEQIRVRAGIPFLISYLGPILKTE